MTYLPAFKSTAIALTLMLALSACGEKKEEAASEGAASTATSEAASTATSEAATSEAATSEAAPATSEAAAVPAGGELNIYNWGNYTNPKLIEKFEKEFNVKVTVTDYDSNDVALAKVKAGGHGFDIVVPSHNFVPIFIQEGLLEETKPNSMPNFKNMDPKWVDVDFDKGRNYTVPWQWGTTGITVNTKAYQGDVNTWAILFDTPAELKGKTNVVPEMSDVIAAALSYKGFDPICNGNKDQLKEVRDLLMKAKPDWISMDYGNVEKYAKEDLMAGLNWNGASMRARLQNDKIVYGYPKEGIAVWMDNVSVIKGAKNVENAKKFQNFIMDPENAALISDFAKYANGISGSEKFLDPAFATAPEIVLPEGQKTFIMPACPPEVTELHTAIWTELTK
ncbi:extracellular solute-binding protein [Dongia sp.]|uniref:extracellular solute-binding protein n=1 Tax=Dongia sp. TaxID=1977262 RepID=UPI0035B1D785